MLKNSIFIALLLIGISFGREIEVKSECSCFHILVQAYGGPSQNFQSGIVTLSAHSVSF